MPEPVMSSGRRSTTASSPMSFRSKKKSRVRSPRSCVEIFSTTRAGEEFRRTIALDSVYVPARVWYALYLSGMGRSDEAIGEISRARELDPLSLIVNTEVGRVLELAHRDGEAERAYERTLEIDSGFQTAN